MKKNLIMSLVIVVGLLGVSLACGISLGGDNDTNGDEDTEALKLQITLQAMQMTQDASSGQNQQTSSPPTPSNGSDTKDVADPTPTDDDGTPCNSSKFVSETIPDFTNMQPGETFAKTWTLRNDGDCDWTENYTFVFEEGDRMNGESSVPVNTVIEPNETVTFKINLKAPNAAGDYVGVWRLKAADGEKLGKYWVKIKVGPPPAPFAVTSVVFSTAASPIDLVCPDDVTVTAKVTASAAGTVTYEWNDCEGGSSSGSIVFDSSGTKSISHSVKDIGFTDTHWAELFIDNPNHQWFGPKEFDVICNP